MNNARIKYPEVFKNCSKKEIKEKIESALMSETKKEILIKYYIYEECMIDLAMEYNLCRQSISKILKEEIE